MVESEMGVEVIPLGCPPVGEELERNGGVVSDCERASVGGVLAGGVVRAPTLRGMRVGLRRYRTDNIRK